MKIELSYQTQEVPPPFAFAASFEIDVGEKNVHLTFQTEYLGRDEMSEEEIAHLGFTSNDDFSWEGELGINWSAVFNRFQLFTYQGRPTDSSYLHVVIDGIEKGFPFPDQEVIAQELIQAAFEAGRKELPLKIQLFDHEKNSKSLIWSFEKRLFTIEDQAYDWESSRLLMSLLYDIEFDDSSVFSSPQTHSICYQDTEEWLKINRKKVVDQIDHSIRQLHKA